MITFIIGGARSGKSRFALELAGNYILSKEGGRKAYIATAQAMDDEMKERIERHRRERPVEWHSIEEPLRIADVLSSSSDVYDVILLDCLTFWLSNLMINNADIELEIEKLVNALRITHNVRVFIVSNEVGLGIVPGNALSRKFRDLSGYLNQRVADIADEVYLMTAGIPLKIK